MVWNIAFTREHTNSLWESKVWLASGLAYGGDFLNAHIGSKAILCQVRCEPLNAKVDHPSKVLAHSEDIEHGSRWKGEQAFAILLNWPAVCMFTLLTVFAVWEVRRNIVPYLNCTTSQAW